MTEGTEQDPEVCPVCLRAAFARVQLMFQFSGTLPAHVLVGEFVPFAWFLSFATLSFVRLQFYFPCSFRPDCLASGLASFTSLGPFSFFSLPA